MPRYEYRCPECGALRESVRPVALRDHPLVCLACIEAGVDRVSPMKRVIQATPHDMRRVARATL